MERDSLDHFFALSSVCLWGHFEVTCTFKYPSYTFNLEWIFIQWRAQDLYWGLFWFWVWREYGNVQLWLIIGIMEAIDLWSYVNYFCFRWMEYNWTSHNVRSISSDSFEWFAHVSSCFSEKIFEYGPAKMSYKIKLCVTLFHSLWHTFNFLSCIYFKNQIEL